jgi:hypothetical protein
MSIATALYRVHLRGKGRTAKAAPAGRGQAAGSHRLMYSLAPTASSIVPPSFMARVGANPGRRRETQAPWVIAGSDASRKFIGHGATRGTAAPRHRTTPYRPPAPLPSELTGVREPAPDIGILVFIVMVQEVQEMVMAVIIVLKNLRRRIGGEGYFDAARPMRPRKEPGA